MKIKWIRQAGRGNEAKREKGRRDEVGRGLLFHLSRG